MVNFYDLFAGIGGFRLGLERSGFKCIGSCEIDKYAREIYKTNFGDYPTERDIREVDPSKLQDFDILTAGFPCQAFSVAGKRMGFDDTRGTLFFEIARIAAAKRPQILFLENVKGLLNHDRGRTFGTIINTLYELGYDIIEWQVINGKYFVPQNRERVFIIGHLRDKPTRKIFPIGEITKINDGTCKKTQRKGKRIWDEYSKYIPSTARSGSRAPYIRTIDANYWQGGRTVIAAPSYLGNTNANGRRIKTHNEPSFTIDTTSNNGVYDGQRIRKLTPLECERLMGFPDNWTQGQSDTQRYKMLGNTVIPQIIEMIGNELYRNIGY